MNQEQAEVFVKTLFKTYGCFTRVVKRIEGQAR
jgi:hypothetical protein